jgi:hypothetical protein
MNRTLVSLLIAAFLQTPSVTRDIEKAFHQGDPGSLKPLLEGRRHILVSFPEPIAVSDLLTPQQTYLILKRILAGYPTRVFYTEEGVFPSDREGLILKSRWSFRDRRSRDPIVFQVFFHLRKTRVDSGRPEWRISEIKAEPL